ncbi:MAG: translation initiation factor IF-2 N-terminal domain-containing protein [Burkholderiaceae bacterium]|nr:translation initiation factor IF-2 N-terminal domain-containing protein [Burkholderiaceae bacterium]
MRVYELAKQLGVESKKLVAECKKRRIQVKNHMSSVSDPEARKLIEYFELLKKKEAEDDRRQSAVDQRKQIENKQREALSVARQALSQQVADMGRAMDEGRRKREEDERARLEAEAEMKAKIQAEQQVRAKSIAEQAILQRQVAAQKVQGRQGQASASDQPERRSTQAQQGGFDENQASAQGAGQSEHAQQCQFGAALRHGEHRHGVDEEAAHQQGHEGQHGEVHPVGARQVRHALRGLGGDGGTHARRQHQVRAPCVAVHALEQPDVDAAQLPQAPEERLRGGDVEHDHGRSRCRDAAQDIDRVPSRR